MSQQEVIDLAIASYLKTNDNTARQYLKLRQEVLETTQLVIKEIKESGAVSPETLLQLEKLKFENAKTSLVYKAYIDNITSNLENESTLGGQISVELNERFDDLLQKKKHYDEKTSQLRGELKPVVEKMRLLASNFEAGIGLGSSGSRLEKSERRLFTSKGSKADDKSVFLDYTSAVFSKSELEAQFVDVESKLAALKTVDEISNEDADTKELSTEKGPSIELSTYLNELLQSGRAYTRINDSTYHFDVTKSTSADLGNSRSVISDYENANELLAKEIQGLVARGTEAKERWISNAQKIEMIQALLQEDMDIDG
ncbi:hypothetical protein METBIDRAFT_46356 [Metschnikowia bicuspidata var. bicuspidata NRRL YB-4993]|uniref:Uncharacterized protein n=1 Tax=Metschnikowia bicuspidata var. bicuspidata NRRL YB-4993 TaxID=869754 RepID=A0A1A0H699_9ASCO|nr:hypothetical protein METBIDRAFT_46356 [Metschnikowia bicuspidata var. bicuspidata NRRL YB-4993]OBA19485.1 hypothetical protein METBIDRAFT_46356 [Metschnikowia bicuspidata var. bicuspidata NRRL YB-4993]